MLLLLSQLAQAATVLVSVHDGADDPESRLEATVAGRTEAPLAWTTADGRQRELLVEVTDAGGPVFVTLRVRERDDHGWALVSQPTLLVDDLQPASFLLGVRRPVLSTPVGKEGGKQARKLTFHTERTLDVRVELLENDGPVAPDVLYLSAFRGVEHTSTWVKLAGELRCPAPLRVEGHDGATVLTAPLSAEDRATWTCTLRGPDGVERPLAVQLRVW